MVSKRLEQVRKSRKIIFQEVVDAAGLTKESYWVIEKGKHGLT